MLKYNGFHVWFGTIFQDLVTYYYCNDQYALIEQSFCGALLAEYSLIKQSTYKNMLPYVLEIILLSLLGEIYEYCSKAYRTAGYFQGKIFHEISIPNFSRAKFSWIVTDSLEF